MQRDDRVRQRAAAAPRGDDEIGAAGDGDSAGRLQLVVEQVRVELQAVAVGGAFREGDAETVDDAALDLPFGTARVEHAAEVVHRDVLEDARDARLAVHAYVCDVAGKRRRGEG